MTVARMIRPIKTANSVLYAIIVSRARSVSRFASASRSRCRLSSRSRSSRARHSCS